MTPSPTLPPEALAVHRDRISGDWSLDRGIVLVPSGLSAPLPGSDESHEFLSHPEHTYLAGREPPGEVLAFDPAEGWTLFAPVATEEERFWLGDTPDLEALSAWTGLERVRDRAEVVSWLAPRRGEPLALLGAGDLVRRSSGYGLPPWDGVGLDVDDELTDRCREAVTAARRKKDGAELALMRRAAEASKAGHLAALRTTHPGISERVLRAEIEAEFVRHGGTRPAYRSIVAGGPNSAVLHGNPGDRELREGDLVLVDAGAAHGGYMSDITRVFPAGRAFTSEQLDLYELVLATEEAAIGKMRPGREYRDIHLEACVELAGGLVHLGLLRGDPESLVARDDHALFFPHGIGHMLGLFTHDVGGYADGRTRSDRFGLKYLRADLRLEPGHVLTIEPGIYFIPALLQNPARREAHRDDVNWEKVDGMLRFGGVRIEDNVHVTEGEPEVLTAGTPKAPGDILSLRRDAL